jgi:hypothetical protein
MRAAEELVLDGNALGALLAEVLVGDPTVAHATCDACGVRAPLAAARLYRGAGLVLRCARCEAVLLCLIAAPGRTFVELKGIRRLEPADA